MALGVRKKADELVLSSVEVLVHSMLQEGAEEVLRDETALMPLAEQFVKETICAISEQESVVKAGLGYL